MSTVDLPLLPLGRGRDLTTERGVECPGDLPAASDPDLVARARAAKAALGERVFVLGHHYQRDEVVEFADVMGDSFKLARDAAGRPEAEFIVFCGVHFMAESADILTADHQQVILPDLAAGCSMADMARLPQVEDAWDALVEAGVADSVVPVTYMNSSADIKCVRGPPRRHGLHVQQRRDRPGVGVRPEARRQGVLLPRPAPRSQHRRAAARLLARRLRRLEPAAAQRRAHRRGAARRAGDPVARALLGPRAVLGGRRRRAAGHHPRRADPRAPGVHPRRRAQGRPDRLDRVHHQDDRGRAGRHVVGDRHRAQPREAARRRPPRTSTSRSSTRTSATARR